MATKILIIDDSATLRMMVKRALVAAGFGVVEATDGVDALAKLDLNGDVGLIVCDINMPRMNGIEFVAAMAGRPVPAPPVIMLTTEGDPELITAAKASGARAWMMKPFKADLLVAAAKKLTGS